jgi:glyoxylase-like metal-dependent hydrolase (beta-lactamase superfamily II)
MAATIAPAEVTTRFTAAPPYTQPLMPWRPEYGGPDDRGQTVHVGGDIYVYMAPDYGLTTNSVYAITSDGVIVLETLLLPSLAEDVIADIRRRTDQPIRYASISHHHPDHTLGSAAFVEAGAELISSYFTARLIDSHTFWYMMFLNGVYGGQLPKGYVVPKSTYVRSRQLWLGRQRIQQFELTDSTTPAGESSDTTATWFPEARALHVADTLLSGMHAFFCDGASVPDWLEQLRQLRELVAELRPRVLLPGHGAPGGVELIDEQEGYLLTVRSMVMEYTQGGEAPLTDEGSARLRADIKAAFPEHRNEMALDISLSLIQMVGPQAFLVGQPVGTRSAPVPAFL